MSDPMTAMAIGGSVLDTGLSIYDRWYNRQLQKKQWEREDSAVQRRINDLRAAGLSPTLAAGSAAASSSPIPVPSLKGPDIQGIMGIVSAMRDISKTKAETDRIVEDTRGQKMANDFFDLTTKPIYLGEEKDREGNLVHQYMSNPRFQEFMNKARQSQYDLDYAAGRADLKEQEAGMYTALKNLGVGKDAIELILGILRTVAPQKAR